LDEVALAFPAVGELKVPQRLAVVRRVEVALAFPAVGELKGYF
jgi:hypothetical protein